MDSKDADKVQPAPDALDNLVSQFADRPPRLEDLDDQSLRVVGAYHQVKQLAAELGTRVKLKGLIWSDLAEVWLADRKTERTVEVYRQALTLFRQWCGSTGTQPLRLDQAGADDFILHLLSSSDMAEKTVRTTASALSSFYSWLARRYEFRNPFLGSRVIGRGKPQTRPPVLDTKALEVILGSVSPRDAGAMAALGYLGIPLGALPSLIIVGDRFEAIFKGRVISGALPAVAGNRLAESGLDMTRPFADRSDRQLTMRLRGQFARLLRRGHLEYQYSARDLQDHWVSQTWKATGDMVAIRDRLGHSSVAVTQKCLDRLGLLPRSR